MGTGGAMDLSSQRGITNFVLIALVINLLFWQSGTVKCFGWMTKFGLEELTDQASHVIVGKVIAKRSSWDSQKTKIYTDVRISVDEVIKGSLNKREIVIRHLGGEIPEEDIGMKVSDMSEFNVGEDVLIFIKPGRSKGKYKLVGKTQGKYTLKNGTVLEKQLMLNDFKNKIKNIIQIHNTPTHLE